MGRKVRRSIFAIRSACRNGTQDAPVSMKPKRSLGNLSGTLFSANALNAAHEATASILEKYKTTEELNQAKLSDLAVEFAGLSIVTEGLVVDGV